MTTDEADTDTTTDEAHTTTDEVDEMIGALRAQLAVSQESLPSISPREPLTPSRKAPRELKRARRNSKRARRISERAPRTSRRVLNAASAADARTSLGKMSSPCLRTPRQSLRSHRANCLEICLGKTVWTERMLRQRTLWTVRTRLNPSQPLSSSSRLVRHRRSLLLRSKNLYILE